MNVVHILCHVATTQAFSAIPSHKDLKLWSYSTFSEQTHLFYWEGADNYDIHEGVKLLDGQFYSIFIVVMQTVTVGSEIVNTLGH